MTTKRSKQQASLLSFFGGGKRSTTPKVTDDKKRRSGVDGSRVDGGKRQKQSSNALACGNAEDRSASPGKSVSSSPLVDHVDHSNDSPVSISTASSMPPSSPDDIAKPRVEISGSLLVASLVDDATSTNAAPIANENEHCDNCNTTTDTTGSAAAERDSLKSKDSDDISDGEDDSDSDQSDSENIKGTALEGGYKLSEYELLRKRNIERNNRRLADLGLVGGSSSARDEEERKRKQRERKKQRRKLAGNVTKARTPVLPTRRSTRSRRSVSDAAAAEGLVTTSTDTSYTEIAPVEAIEEEMEVFKVSPVVDYAMKKTFDGCSGNDKSENQWTSAISPKAITSLEPIGMRLAPPNGLNAIYTLQFFPKEWVPSERLDDRSWIVGAGKAGIVSLWDCSWRSGCSDGITEENSVVDPILSWKAHGGRWVADVRFLPAPASASGDRGGTPSRCLSAANDGCVCLWDLTSVSVQSGAPKLLSRTGKELHRSGIFAMDVSVGEQTYVCTGSKDKTVAVTTLDSITRGNAANPLWVSDYHAAKVGAVGLCGKGTSLLASASDDGSIAIHDFRNNKTVAEILDAHSRPHSVVWNPLSENELMTAGNDDVIKLFDTRSLDKPLLSYQGHVPLLKRYKRIHHPVFYNPCSKLSNSEQFVLSGGEGSQSLSLFRNQDAKQGIVPVYSRGTLPSDCGDAGCLAIEGEKVASAVDGGEVLLLSPQIRKSRHAESSKG
mmetsp:Transcript_50702/g.152704  ORF Transcript_50702/g.152704 Transcript_50702/m.152704 type:complete len:724 (-) Transcript_50702:53-2224(-)